MKSFTFDRYSPAAARGEEGFVISTINFVAEAPGGFVPDSKSRSTIHESVNIPVPVNRISSASPNQSDTFIDEQK